MNDAIKYKTAWTIRRYADIDAYQRGEPYSESKVEGNLLLNEGIGELWDLACGLGSPTAFSNANAYLGVGDSATAESAAHTGLQASTNKLYKAMESGYPQRSGQTVTWRSVFGSSEANFDWNEFTVANGNSDAADNLKSLELCFAALQSVRTGTPQVPGSVRRLPEIP